MEAVLATEFDDSAHWGFFMTGTTLTSETGKYARLSELVLAGLRAQGILDTMEDGITPPTTDKLWLDKNFDPAVLKRWDGSSAWVAVTFTTLFATAAEGDMAATAVQPGDLATVATSGSYSDLSNTPAFGTAAFSDDGDFATAAQGSTADSAVQSIGAGTNVSVDATDPQNPVVSVSGIGSGDVVGPASAVDDRIATFDGTTGKLIQDGGATIAGVQDINGLTGKTTPVDADEFRIADSAASFALKKLSLANLKTAMGKRRIQEVSSFTGAVATGTTVIPSDDTIPQITEGDQYLTVTITPTNAANILEFDAQVIAANNSGAAIVVALFQTGTANALAALQFGGLGSGVPSQGTIKWRMVAGSTSALTFTIRAGPTVAATLTFNGAAGARKFGGVMNSFLVVREVSP